MKFAKYWLAVVVFTGLSACGGGGGNPGTSSGAVVATPAPAASAPSTAASGVAVAADFFFELDKVTVTNSGGDKAVLKVTAVDSNRNVKAGVPVRVSVDSGGVFSGTAAETDASGTYSGAISIGSDKTDRTINATIKLGELSKVASIFVRGSKISVVAVPATPAPGQSVKLLVSATDSAGTAISNALLKVTSAQNQAVDLTTDLSGNVENTFTAPSSNGVFNVDVSGLGVRKTLVLQVVSPGSSTVPAAVGLLSSASLTPKPTSIGVNAPNSTASRSTLSAKFLTPDNKAIQNMRVRFVIEPPDLGSGEAISVGSATVYSDVNGVAEADYIPGSRSSPTNGVRVRVCFKADDFLPTDFDAIGLCPTLGFRQATLTVIGAPLSISIGDDNLLEKGLGSIAYIKKFLIQVNDSAGAAVKDAIVSVSVDIKFYGKGIFGAAYPGGALPPIADSNVNGVGIGIAPSGARSNVAIPIPPTGAIAASPGTPPTLAVPASPGTPADPTATPPTLGTPPTLAQPATPGTPATPAVPATPGVNVWCANEDWNRNGSLDTGEDINGDGIIQPRKAEIIVSYLSGNKTDVNGQLLVQVSYPQNMGSWLTYALRATTAVGGSEGDASKNYIADILKDDLENGSFRVPPFGIGNCSSKN
jgi:hypothetical protein